MASISHAPQYRQELTARYTKATKTATLKEVQDKIYLDGIDLDWLDQRAQELFISKGPVGTR